MNERNSFHCKMMLSILFKVITYLNMKYIMMTMQGRPNISETRKELRHFLKAKFASVLDCHVWFNLRIISHTRYINFLYVYQRCGSTRIHYIWQDPDSLRSPLYPDPDPFSGKVDPRIQIRIHYSQMWIPGSGSGSTSK